MNLHPLVVTTATVQMALTYATLKHGVNPEDTSQPGPQPGLRTVYLRTSAYFKLVAAGVDTKDPQDIERAAKEKLAEIA